MQYSEIEFLPFIIPKVHSTSLRIDSAHLDHICSLTEDDALKGHISEVVRLNTRCHLLAFAAKVEKQLQATVSIQ